MLDFPSSSSRKWLGFGVVFIFLSALLGFNALELSVVGDLTPRQATVAATGEKRDPALFFLAKGDVYSCAASRCRYINWRNDIGRMADITVDEKRQVSSITVNGNVRLDVAGLKWRSFQRWMLSSLLVIAGVLMCWRAHALHRVVKGD